VQIIWPQTQQVVSVSPFHLILPLISPPVRRVQTPSTRPEPPDRQLRFAWTVWGLLWITAGTVAVWPRDYHPVNESYAHGARCWRRGELLYKGCGTGFIYPPHAAMLHLPFLRLPHIAYEFAWRLVTIGLFGAGVYRLSRFCQDSAQVALFPL